MLEEVKYNKRPATSHKIRASTLMGSKDYHKRFSVAHQRNEEMLSLKNTPILWKGTLLMGRQIKRLKEKHTHS